ncbi:MAG: DUF2156 domain-containing protein [Christensenellales bacterium]|jgi:hypothetical protein|nr:DUF2156 domain-containing protein [Clostridiales bacterium]
MKGCPAPHKQSKKDILDFRPIELKDYGMLNKFLEHQPYRICDYTRGVLYMWQEHLNYSYAISHDMLIISSHLNNNTTFSIPLGKGDLYKALDDIESFCAQNGCPLNFHGVTKQSADLLTEYFGDRFEIKEIPNWGEYLYNFDDLLYLKGKKYHSKRNHINGFKRLYPDYVYKKLTSKDIPAVKEFLKKYYSETSKDHFLFEIEKQMLYNVLDNYDRLDLKGGYIEVEGKMAAFAIGEKLRNTLYVHIEKADKSYKGSYAVINNEFVKNNQESGVVFVNREEDAGDQGLRKAKLSYYPVEIIKKYSVKERA